MVWGEKGCDSARLSALSWFESAAVVRSLVVVAGRGAGQPRNCEKREQDDGGERHNLLSLLKDMDDR